MVADSQSGLPDEDEIDLLDYWRVMWGRRWMIILVTVTAAALAVVVSLILPNVYRAETVLAPVEDEGGGLPSGLLAGLGGVGALAGMLPGSSGGTDEYLAVLRSRDFLWKFVRDEQLMPTLFVDEWDSARGAWVSPDVEDQPQLWDAYRLFTQGGVLSTAVDRKSGLVTIAVEWTDPELAAEWANQLVARLNEYLRQREMARSDDNLSYLGEELKRTQVAEIRDALFELISTEQKKAMLARTQKEFAFQVIDPAAAPDKKASPKRGLIVVVAVVLAGIIAVFLAFLMEAVSRSRKLDRLPNQRRI